MKKLFPNILTFSLFSLAFFEIYFYSGFVQKHFFFDFFVYLILYSLIAFFIFKFKKISLSTKLIKLNNFLFIFLLLIYFLLIFLEQYNYPNFVYGNFHLNPANFIYLPLLSLIIIFIYQNKLFQKLFYFVLPLLTVYLSQIISFGKNFNFQKFSTPHSIFINYFLWSAFLLISLLPFKKRKHSLFLFSFFFILFSLFNHYKIKYLNVFFSLSDLKLANNATGFILPFIKDYIISLPFILLTFLFFFILFLVSKFYKQNNPTFKFRFLLFIISLFLIIYPIYYPDNYKDKVNKSNIDLDISNPINNCKNNGILFCFYDDFKNLRFPIPSGYNQNTINQIYSQLPSLSKEFPKLNSKQEIKPNIIVVLSEALWDATKLPQVSYSQDPIKNFRPDIKSTLVSPVYGGSTANVEFEILTGFSNYFLNNRYPYNQLINQKIPSLFSLFKDNNYQTTAIHTFKKSMYRRPMVYQYFGLDKYIAEEDMTDTVLAGPYISDKYFTQQIINQFESTTQPQFIFAISMQNHMPYDTNRYPKEINIKSNLSPEDSNILQSYIDGIKLSSDSYLDLKNYLSKSAKPTIIIFYGDHLPFLNDNFAVYKNLNFVPKDQQKWSQTDYKNMYTTPIMVWSNYQTNLDINSILSPNFLSLEILKLANIKTQNQFLFLESLSKTDTVLNKYLESKFSSDQLKDYELIQYDLLSGKQYLLR